VGNSLECGTARGVIALIVDKCTLWITIVDNFFGAVNANDSRLDSTNSDLALNANRFAC
jgi:hypothetical protein